MQDSGFPTGTPTLPRPGDTKYLFQLKSRPDLLFIYLLVSLNNFTNIAAIHKCKQQLSSSTTHDYDLNRLSECNSDQTSEVPVLEEFIPIKRAVSEEQESKKPDWLSSVKLWNQTPDASPHQVNTDEFLYLFTFNHGFGHLFF